MKCASFLVMATCLVYSALLFGQDSTSSTQPRTEPPKTNSDDKEPAQPNPENKHGPIDVLSDTKGMDMHPYLDRVLSSVRANWYNLVPESARAPIMKKGEVLIRFRVMKDGKIEDMHYVKSSGDIALDRAAYGGIVASSPLPPMPSDFGCKYLALQFHFLYNPGKGDVVDKKKTTPLVPCVTTIVRLVGEVAITVFPGSAQMVTGAKQQFLTTVTGDLDAAVTWSVSGPGCAASTCGVISADGLYTAPLRIPNPATITVTATSATTPSETASATVTIVQSSPSR
jgi:TonB family protein